MIEVAAKRERELLERIRGVDGVMSVMLTGQRLISLDEYIKEL